MLLAPATNTSMTEIRASSQQVSTHPIVARSKFNISRPNKRYALLTIKSTPLAPKTVSASLKHPTWTA